MLLALDIGNTNIVAGVFDAENLKATFRYETVRRRGSDEQALLLKQLLELHGIAPLELTGSILCSVVPQVTRAVAEGTRVVTDTTPLIVGEPNVKLNIRIQSDSPREVGSDRIVNAIAARARGPGPIIVVDFGTATTFDCVSETGDYIGGAIVPGIQISLDALVTSAARLSKVDLVAPRRAIGKNSTHALQSGIVFGYASLVDGLVERISQEMTRKPRVLATGGLAGLIAEHTTSIEEVVPSLTLDGLRILYETQR